MVVDAFMLLNTISNPPAVATALHPAGYALDETVMLRTTGLRPSSVPATKHSSPAVI